jgi:hypothetical protein
MLFIILFKFENIFINILMKNSYSYKYQGRNYTTNNSFIQEGNDFSKYIKHKRKK